MHTVHGSIPLVKLIFNCLDCWQHYFRFDNIQCLFVNCLNVCGPNCTKGLKVFCKVDSKVPCFYDNSVYINVAGRLIWWTIPICRVKFEFCTTWFVYRSSTSNDPELFVVLPWEPRLPARCRKLRFYLFFPLKVDPLSLESQNQTFPWISRVPQFKIWGKSVQGFRSYDQTNKQTNIDYNFIYIDIHRIQDDPNQWRSPYYRGNPQHLYAAYRSEPRGAAALLVPPALG